MYVNLKKVLQQRGIDLYYFSKAVGIRYRDLIKKLDGEEEFDKSELNRIYDFISDVGSAQDFFDYLFATSK